MDGLQTIFIFLLGLVSCSHNGISASVLEVTFRPGENVTLYCDCKASTGIYITWFFRKCSHENESPYVITVKDQLKQKKNVQRLKFVKNDSSESYDLLVINATNSDVGFYYCGTKEKKVDQDKERNIFTKDIYNYGNITIKLTLDTCEPCSDFKKTVEDCDACWKLLFSLCPTVFLLSVLFTSLLFYLLCHKTGEENQDDRNQPEQKRHAEETQDENICYAALEIHQPSKRTKKKRMIQSSHNRTHTMVMSTSSEGSPWM